MRREKEARLKELLDKASSGPWIIRDLPSVIQVCTDPDKLMGLAMAVVNLPKSESPSDDALEELAATANLIAAMRNEMPLLLDELSALRASQIKEVCTKPYPCGCSACTIATLRVANAALRASRDRMREALTELLVGAENTLPFPGAHEGAVLRRHEQPCLDVDFCVYLDAQKRIDSARAALSSDETEGA